MTVRGGPAAAGSLAKEPSTRMGVDVPGTAESAKILVVDDLPEKFLVYETILEELGQTLVYASSGAEALKQVLRDEFAVILLDVNMPGMDGFEAASLIRSRRRSASTPIIFLTAFADEVRIAQGYASGAVDYIPTPVVPEILRAKVRVFVELFQVRRQAAAQAEEHAKKLAAEEAARRFAFLAGAGDRLNGSLDFDTSLRTFADVAIPYLADLAMIRVDGDPSRDPAVGCAWQGHGQRKFQRLAGSAWMDAVSEEVTKDERPLERAPTPTALSGGPEGLEDAPPFDGGSVLALPVATRGRVLGVAVLARAATRPAFQEADVTLAQDVINRGAVALENALLVQTIRETDKRKDEFLATLAHELRNPLAPVRNAVEILNLAELRDPHVEYCRSIIDRQVRQLARLVDDLLDVSRINSGKIELRRERIDVAAVIERAAEISRAAIEAFGHELSVRLPTEPVVLDVDPVRIAQVVANLLNNASKYTAPGGRIELAVARRGEDVEIAVRDNGIGIPPAMLGAIFDMFTQVENTLDRSQGGLGVGLSLARRLVDLHGGTISAFSEGPGQGSEFIVRLPVSDGPPPRTTPADAKDDADAVAPLNILVVDDNRDSAQSLAILLRHSGHSVHVAFDGQAALAAAAELCPQIVFLDLGMPGLSGFDVAARFRADETLRGAILVALTGWGQEEDRRRTTQAGFHFHCTKPIPMEELAAVINLGRAASSAAPPDAS